MQSLVVESYGDEHTLRLHRMPHPITDLATRAEQTDWPSALQRVLRLDGSDARPALPARHRETDVPSAGYESRERGLAHRLATRAGHTVPGLHLRARSAREDGRAHLAGLLAAEDVIWVPGGEITEIGGPMGRLLDITVAEAAGKRVTMVDFSFEPAESALAYFRHIAAGVTTAVPRDQRSADILVDLGFAPEAVEVVPDAVFLLGTDGVGGAVASRSAGPPRLAVVPNRTIDIDADEWRRAVRIALAKGFEVEVVSSHHEQDEAALRQLLDGDLADRVEVAPEITDLDEFLAYLGRFTDMLSGRFHSAVMGILTGLSVSAVDTFGTKVIGGMTAPGFDEVVLTPEGFRSGSWVDQFEARLGVAHPIAPARIAEAQERIAAGLRAAVATGA